MKGQLVKAFGDVIAVYYHTKHINSLHGQSAIVLMLEQVVRLPIVTTVGLNVT